MKTDSCRSVCFYTAIFSLFLTAVTSCSTTKNPDTASKSANEKKVVVTPPTAIVSANGAPGLERELLTLVNEYRQSKKLPPLLPNQVIEYQARRHSMDMATHRIPFGHQGLNFRIKYISEKLPNTTQVAENVAFGNLTAKTVVSGWLKSAGHRQNMEGNYKFTGIGVTRNMQNQLYFTQLFAR